MTGNSYQQWEPEKYMNDRVEPVISSLKKRADDCRMGYRTSMASTFILALAITALAAFGAEVGISPEVQRLVLAGVGFVVTVIIGRQFLANNSTRWSRYRRAAKILEGMKMEYLTAQESGEDFFKEFVSNFDYAATELTIESDRP